MARGRHAAQHSDQHGQQHHSRRDWAPASPRRRRKAVRLGVVALGTAFSLLAAAAAMQAATKRQDAAQVSTLSCRAAPRLAADSSAVTTPLGVNASGPSQLATATSLFGHMPVIRVYYAGVPSASEWSTGVLAMSNSAVVLSFNPSPAQVLSGADNGALAAFFNASRRGHAIYYSFYPEPEAHIRQGEFSFAQYKAAWARVASIADAAHNPDLHATLILQGQSGRPGDEYDFRNYLPAGGVISVLGWDAYPVGTVEEQQPQQTSPAQFMGADIAASRSVGLPFGFAEFALGTAAGQPQWLGAVASYLQNQGALFGTLFDATGFPWMMLRDSASIQAWRAEVAGSASGTPVAAPPPAPTPAPTSSTPSPSPTASKRIPVASPPAATTSPVAGGLAITGLSVSPKTLSVVRGHHLRVPRFKRVRIRFRLNQAAGASICLLNSHGRVVREMDRPALAAGWAARSFAGYDQHHRLLPAGHYMVMVVASNPMGSATAQLALSLTK
jgi:hypothetical protein